MILYSYFRSSAAWRVRIALNLKGLSPEQRFVNLREGEQRSADYLALNPQGMLPALDTGSGVLSQSLAILEWLDETHPTPSILPGDATQRARIRAFALTIACDVHPLQNLRVLKHLESAFGQDQAGKDRWCQQWIGQGLAACEAIAAQGHGAFVFGDSPTMADICLIPQLYGADRFGLDLSPFPRLRAIRQRAEALPAFAAAHPAQQPDAI